MATMCVDFSLETRLQYDSCSRGVSGTLHLQSAIAGVILRRGHMLVKLPLESDVDVWVSRDGNL